MILTENDISGIILDASIRIHSQLGPGLFESVYQKCLAHELQKGGLRVQQEVILPIEYDDLIIKDAFKIDLLVNDIVIIELKAVTELQPIHHTQLTTYLRLSNKRLGLLINFGGYRLMDGYKRLVNNLK